MSDYRPTHSLLVRSVIRGSPDYNKTVLAAFESAMAYADEARFRIERDTMRIDHPEVVNRLDKVFSSTPSHGATMYHSTDVRNALNVLSALLEISGPSATGIRELSLSVDGECCLQYVPEHNQFTVADDVAGGIATAVADAVSDKPAILLPECPLAEWVYDDKEFHVGTALCVERKQLGFSTTNCYGLDRLKAVAADSDELTIQIRWESREHNQIGEAIDRAVGLVASAIGASRPEVLHFEREDDFATVRDALEQIVDGLHGERGS